MLLTVLLGLVVMGALLSGNPSLPGGVRCTGPATAGTGQTCPAVGPHPPGGCRGGLGPPAGTAAAAASNGLAVPAAGALSAGAGPAVCPG